MMTPLWYSCFFTSVLASCLLPAVSLRTLGADGFQDLPFDMSPDLKEGVSCPDPFEMFPCTCANTTGVQVACDGVLDEAVASRALHAPGFPPNPLQTFALRWGTVEAIGDDFFGERQFMEVLLEHNRLANISSAALMSQQPSLTLLDVSYNLLTQPILPLLAGFPKLQHLVHNNNLLTNLSAMVDLPEGALPGLERLYLKGNDITSLPWGAFRCVPGVTLLDLSFNNMSYISPGAFEGLHQLSFLALDGNNLNRLGHLEVGRIVLAHPAGTVSMMRANIEELAPTFIEGLDDHSMLELSHNPLRSFPEDVFGDVLRTLTVSDIPYRTGIRIYYNWISCDCGFLWLAKDRWLNAHVYGGYCGPRTDDWKDWRSIHTVDPDLLEAECAANTTTLAPPGP